MPLRELKCETCGTRFDELVRASEFLAFLVSAENDEYVHLVDGEECGTCRFVTSLPAAHNALRDYPFVTAPWFLPPTADGKINQVEVGSRAEYKALLKKHNILEPETSSDKLTMYDRRPQAPSIDNDVRKDVQFFNEMKRSPDARKNIIKSALQKREAAGQ